MRDYRSIASIGAIVLGVLMIIGGIATWTLVSSELEAQSITVADDADWFAGETVNGPFDAYSQAEIIEKHALDATDGQTYAELPRDSELRPVAMNASFLRASLYTSIVAFGVAAMAIGMGIVFVLIGLGMRDVRAVARTAESKAATTV
ncbi:MAG: hypothetical protein R3343_06285 [Nitriliruptorales bacterium]|nr:hypothetical protein [Nitriliruptorales bacterium]